MIKSASAIEIRGNMYTLMSLVLSTSDHALVARSLHERVQQAPGFLSNVPVIVDFSSVSVPAGYNFNLLFKVIRQQSILPVAVRGLPESMQTRLQAAGVPVVEMSAPRSGTTDPAGSNDSDLLSGKGGAAAESGVIIGKPGEALLIDRSLLSGERCYAQGSDLTVLGDCQSDSELISDGHIHVYGALRGKAAAGFKGDKRARIFCHTFAAGMVSIAGIGSASLLLPENQSNTMQFFLQNDVIVGKAVGD